MKIAFLAESFLLDQGIRANGTLVQLYNLARGFAEIGMDVNYIASTKNLNRETKTVEKIKLHWLKARRGVFSWVLNLFDYKKMLNQINPDIVYQRGRSYLTYVAAEWAKKNQKKFVWGSNGEDGCDFWKNISRLRRSKSSLLKKAILAPNALLQDIMIHKAIRACDIAINQTEYQKERLLKNFGKKGIVLPSYFPLIGYRTKPQKKEKIVLWLANLSPAKQPEVFIRLAEYCRDCDGWRFILAGGTGNKAFFEKIKQLAKSVKNLEMIGSIPFGETFAWFERAYLFVNTSIAEGLSNTFIQAWLARTPVLSLRHDPNGWIKKHNLGWCTEGGLSIFLEKAKIVLEDEDMLQKLGDECQRFAIRTFATEKIIDAYMHLFKTGS